MRSPLAALVFISFFLTSGSFSAPLPQPEETLIGATRARLIADKTPELPHQANGMRIRFLKGQADRVVTGHLNGEVILWDVKGKKIIWRKVVQENGLWGLEVSPDGKFVFALVQDGLMKALHAENGELALTSKVFEKGSPTLMVSSRSSQLVALARGLRRTELFWQSYDSGSELELGDQGTAIRKGAFMSTAVAASDDGKLVAMTNAYSVDGYIKRHTLDVYDTVSQQLVNSIERSEDMGNITFSPDSRSIAYWGYARDPQVALVHLETKTETILHPEIEYVGKMLFTRDGKYLIVNGQGARQEGKPLYNLRVFEAATAKFRYAIVPAGYQPVLGSKLRIADYDITSDGRQMAIAIADGKSGADAAGMPDVLVFDFLP